MLTNNRHRSTPIHVCSDESDCGENEGHVIFDTDYSIEYTDPYPGPFNDGSNIQDKDLGFVSEDEGPLRKNLSTCTFNTGTSTYSNIDSSIGSIPTTKKYSKKSVKNHLNIYFSGPHSVGKSTLIADLHRRHGDFQVREEHARIYMRDKNITAEDFDPQKMPNEFEKVERDLLKMQVERERMDEQESGVFLNDRGLDALIYLIHYHREGDRIVDDIIRNDDGVKMCIEKAKRPSSLTFILKPHQKLLEDDRIRMLSSIEDLEQFYRKMVDFYRDVLKIPFVTVEYMDRSERLEKISSQIIEFRKYRFSDDDENDEDNNDEDDDNDVDYDDDDTKKDGEDDNEFCVDFAGVLLDN